ncbi:hypothetical protein M4578_16310 [Salipiger sp. P9]|uniref:hypothetical protein n=1 Tax=Salipiger pentaromativorans TaxID=2943193 RepID=UPI002158A13D|nr:hypothetical protein [Salipiger pentaromativorans]MCR8549396.1 hypothetical protein [Salipiger pentaromativorans]
MKIEGNLVPASGVDQEPFALAADTTFRDRTRTGTNYETNRIHDNTTLPQAADYYVFGGFFVLVTSYLIFAIFASDNFARMQKTSPHPGAVVKNQQRVPALSTTKN